MTFVWVFYCRNWNFVILQGHCAYYSSSLFSIPCYSLLFIMLFADSAASGCQPSQPPVSSYHFHPQLPFMCVKFSSLRTSRLTHPSTAGSSCLYPTMAWQPAVTFNYMQGVVTGHHLPIPSDSGAGLQAVKP